MNIELPEVTIAQQEYFRLSMRYIIKKMWWYCILAPVFCVWLLLSPKSDSSALIILALIIFPLFIVLFTWRASRDKKNAIFFKKHKVSLSDSSFISQFGDGSNTELRWENFIKVEITKKYILLYISKMQFIVLPKSAFKNQHDVDTFVEFLSMRES